MHRRREVQSSRAPSAHCLQRPVDPGPDTVKRTDFSYRAAHDVTVAGKASEPAFYRRPAFFARLMRRFLGSLARLRLTGLCTDFLAGLARSFLVGLAPVFFEGLARVFLAGFARGGLAGFARGGFRRMTRSLSIKTSKTISNAPSSSTLMHVLRTSYWNYMPSWTLTSLRLRMRSLRRPGSHRCQLGRTYHPPLHRRRAARFSTTLTIDLCCLAYWD